MIFGIRANQLSPTMGYYKRYPPGSVNVTKMMDV